MARSRAGLRRRERLHEGREDRPELHGHRRPHGVEEVLVGANRSVRFLAPIWHDDGFIHGRGWARFAYEPEKVPASTDGNLTY